VHSMDGQNTSALGLLKRYRAADKLSARRSDDTEASNTDAHFVESSFVGRPSVELGQNAGFPSRGKAIGENPGARPRLIALPRCHVCARPPPLHQRPCRRVQRPVV
jgi:hypothetical protein